MPDSRSANVGLLLLEADQNLRERLAAAIAAQGFSVTKTSSAEEALALAAAQPFVHAVLSPDVDATIELVRRLRASAPQVNVLIFASHRHSAAQVAALAREGVRYLQKPADAQDVLEALGVPPNPKR